MKTLNLFIILLVYQCVGQAQQFNTFENVPELKEEYISQTKKKYKSDRENIEGVYKKEIKKIYET